MSPDVSAQREDDRLPPAESWYTGRRWAGVISAVLACANVVLVVVDLSGGHVETTRDWLLNALRVVLVVTFTLLALGELRTRVVVDAEGVHQQRLVHRRSHRWEEIVDVRPPERTWGEPTVELVRRDREAVPLPRSADHLHVLRRWHAATTGSTEPLPPEDVR